MTNDKTNAIETAYQLCRAVLYTQGFDPERLNSAAVRLMRDIFRAENGSDTGLDSKRPDFQAKNQKKTNN